MATDLESSRWSALDWSRSSLWRNWIVRWCKTLASSWQWVNISEANETNEASCLRHADSVWLLMNWRISSSSLSFSNFVFNRLKRTGVTCRNTNGILKFKLFYFYFFRNTFRRFDTHTQDTDGKKSCDRPGRLHWNNWATTNKKVLLGFFLVLSLSLIHSFSLSTLYTHFYKEGQGYSTHTHYYTLVCWCSSRLKTIESKKKEPLVVSY